MINCTINNNFKIQLIKLFSSTINLPSQQKLCPITLIHMTQNTSPKHIMLISEALFKNILSQGLRKAKINNFIHSIVSVQFRVLTSVTGRYLKDTQNIHTPQK